MSAVLDEPRAPANGDLRGETAPHLTAIVPEVTTARDVSRLRGLLGLWVIALLAGMALVVYGFGPFFQARDQRALLRRLRSDVQRSANEASGLLGVSVPRKPPAPGAPVGILEIGALRLQQAVVEGTGSTETRKAPGHVPGTAGLGQPGNSVMVGRHTAFGGPFARIGELRAGDEILITTTQGQSVYEVRSRRVLNVEGVPERVYGPSKDDRLTMVTSATRLPWNTKRAVVVVAALEGTAFAPTPQAGRSDREVGTHGDAGVTASIVLAMLGYGLAMGIGVLLYRRLQPRTAYLLTAAPVVVLTVVGAETLSRIFPAWM